MENSRNDTRKSKVGKVEDKPDKESFISDYVNRREYMNMTDSLSNLYDKYFTTFQQKIERLEEKEIRGDRLIVDLEHQKAVLKSEIRTMEEVVSRVQSELWTEIEEKVKQSQWFALDVVRYLKENYNITRKQQ